MLPPFHRTQQAGEVSDALPLPHRVALVNLPPKCCLETIVTGEIESVTSGTHL